MTSNDTYDTQELGSLTREEQILSLVNAFVRLGNKGNEYRQGEYSIGVKYHNHIVTLPDRQYEFMYNQFVICKVDVQIDTDVSTKSLLKLVFTQNPFGMRILEWEKAISAFNSLLVVAAQWKFNDTRSISDTDNSVSRKL